MKQCSNDCNQMLGGKRVREEKRLPHIVTFVKNVRTRSFLKVVIIKSSGCSKEQLFYKISQNSAQEMAVVKSFFS